jgi:hypothetical protein
MDARGGVIRGWAHAIERDPLTGPMAGLAKSEHVHRRALGGLPGPADPAVTVELLDLWRVAPSQDRRHPEGTGDALDPDTLFIGSPTPQFIL